ncbi:hypothetical protein MTP99_017936 [Tenebrio molitor]|nr:hypothetical protein MTP99_017936 [Tenebrio molitor]
MQESLHRVHWGSKPRIDPFESRFSSRAVAARGGHTSDNRGAPFNDPRPGPPSRTTLLHLAGFRQGGVPRGPARAPPLLGRHLRRCAQKWPKSKIENAPHGETLSRKSATENEFPEFCSDIY